MLTLVAKIELNCDVPAVEDYAQEIGSQVSTRLDERPYRYQPGSGRVGLNLSVSPDGTVPEVEIVRADFDLVAEKAITAIKELSPFRPPPSEHLACYSRFPVRISVKVQGYKC